MFLERLASFLSLKLVWAATGWTDWFSDWFSGVHELQETEHGGLEHRRRADGLQRGASEYPADVLTVVQQQ